MPHSFFRFKHILLALLWLTCCQFALAQTAAKSNANNRGMLWEVKSGKNVVHVFGAIHLAKPDFYPLPKQVDQAFNAAQLLVVEADISTPDLMEKIGNSLQYTAPDKLENHLSPQAWAKLKQRFGDSVEALQGTKLATLNSMLVVQYLSAQGYASDKGIDLHFLQRAKATNKTVAELEGIQFQMNLMTNISDSDGEAWLMQSLQSIADGELLAEMEKMSQAWLTGDEKKLAQALQQSNNKDEISKKMMQVFFADRNPGISKTIAQFVNDGKPAFIVMGAGHCVGQGNVLELLQKQGYSVRRINSAQTKMPKKT